MMEKNFSESSKPFEEGLWYPEQNGYYHICPQCGRDFFGCKNRIYCPGDKCKCVFNRTKNAGKQGLIVNF